MDCGHSRLFTGAPRRPHGNDGSLLRDDFGVESALRMERPWSSCPHRNHVECNIEIAHATVNLVENRFLYHKDIEGEAVLQVHDDVQVAEKTVDALYEQWKRTPEAIVGVESEGRTFEADGLLGFSFSLLAAMLYHDVFLIISGGTEFHCSNGSIVSASHP